MTMARYDERARDALAENFDRDGFVLLPSHFSRATLEAWRAAFAPLFAPHEAAAREQGGSGNRGPDAITSRCRLKANSPILPFFAMTTYWGSSSELPDRT